uniref:Uncharacterized protein n=1 Tax=Helianthus annuus TaxID=4232 RepID=A0A251UJX5_HELAN
MIPTQNPLVVLGLMEVIFRLLSIPTSKPYFCFDQTVFTIYKKKDKRILKHSSKPQKTLFWIRYLGHFLI